jgi:hypothetical protein
MRRLFATAVLATTLGASTLVASPVMAADGRPNTAKGEIAAVLHHALGRDASGPQPDEHSVERYLPFAKKNCQWGAVDASFRMVTSTEAQARWNHNDQDLAGMLYAALLDRAPDDEGLRTYTRAINEHGIGWSAAQMMGSNEYKDRLASYCNTSVEDLNATMHNWQSALDFAANVLVGNAINLAASCGAVMKVEDLVDIRKNPTNKQLFIGVTGSIASSLHDQLDGTCEAVKQYLEAAYHIAVLVTEGGDNYNPVFIQYDTHKSLLTGHFITYFAVRVGVNPTDWREWEGKTSAA